MCSCHCLSFILSAPCTTRQGCSCVVGIIRERLWPTSCRQGPFQSLIRTFSICSYHFPSIQMQSLLLEVKVKRLRLSYVFFLHRSHGGKSFRNQAMTFAKGLFPRTKKRGWANSCQTFWGWEKVCYQILRSAIVCLSENCIRLFVSKEKWQILTALLKAGRQCTPHDWEEFLPLFAIVYLGASGTLSLEASLFACQHQF